MWKCAFDPNIYRCNSCSTTYLEDGDQVIIPIDGEDVHEAYEGLEDDDLNNSKQDLLHLLHEENNGLVDFDQVI